MPQLNPVPWFLTFLLSWWILTIMTAPKLLSTLPQKQLDLASTSQNMKPRTWPWL